MPSIHLTLIASDNRDTIPALRWPAIASVPASP